MPRFMSCAAPSGAEQPAAKRPAAAASDWSGAEQPATARPNVHESATRSYSKIVSIGDVQLWLAELPIGRCGSADVRRIREAAVVLARGKPRKEDVRPLQSKWRVAQKKEKKPRLLSEVLEELRSKVIKAAQKLELEQVGRAAQPAPLDANMCDARISSTRDLQSRKRPKPREAGPGVHVQGSETLIPASRQSEHECGQRAQEDNVSPLHPEQHAGGAEQPAQKKPAVCTTPGTEQQAKDLISLEGCERWLATLTPDGPVRRLLEAIRLLQTPASRTRRHCIQNMLKSWGVQQKKKRNEDGRASGGRGSREESAGRGTSGEKTTRLAWDVQCHPADLSNATAEWRLTGVVAS